jgi:hypothetical protein
MGYGVTEGFMTTHDDVVAAFNSGRVLQDSGDRLLEYLQVLCSEQIRSDENRLLANNRCVTINTILMRRFLQREMALTTRLNWVVIVLAALAVIGTAVQVYLALNGKR